VKRFEFSLDRLLKVKRQLESLAELEQQKAESAVQEAHAVVAQLQEQLARVAEGVNGHVGHAMSPHQWVNAYQLSDRLGQSLAIAEQVAEKAELRWTEARRERAQVAAEVEALDTLQHQQKEKWQREYEAANQEQLDDIGLRRWMAAQAVRAGAA
jgi:flagellar protein FliJ